jgi:hypothetical protein
MEPTIRSCTSENGINLAHLDDDGVRLREWWWTNG